MRPSRRAFGRLVAALELACAAAVAVGAAVLGLGAELTGGAGRLLLDRSFPFLLGATVLVGLGGLALRRWREPAPGPAPLPGASAPGPVRPPEPLSVED